MTAPPQLGRVRPPTTAEDEKVLLRRRHQLDRTDSFATDTDSQVQRLGRLALRRNDPDDYAELADLCSALSFSEQTFHLSYIQKTLLAFQRLSQYEDVRAPVENYLCWVAETAQHFPMRENLAAALWALTHAHLPVLERSLLQQWLELLKTEAPPTVLPAPAHERSIDTHLDMETRADVLSDDLESRWQDTADAHADDLDTLEARDRAVEDLLAPASQIQMVRDDMDYQVGDSIGSRYEVKHIFKGGMGIVYICYDMVQHTPVALKTFQNRFLNNDRAIARFTQEALTWIRLEKNPYVVQALRVQKFGSRPYILLENITGPEGLGADLRAWIEHRRIDLETALRFALHICLGMQHAVRQMPGLVHRDLKPANILVRHDGLAKVTDFGLVRSIQPDETHELELPDPHLTRTGAMIGTAAYMSPEQASSHEVDIRSDIYAFGCILYEMLSYQPVFRAKSRQEWIKAHQTAPARFPRGAAAPQDVRRLVLDCLAKDPNRRPANWDVLVEKLTQLYYDITGQAPIVEGAKVEVEDLLNKAYSLTEIGYASEALHAYERALSLEPKNAKLWTLKARTLRLLERYDEALHHVSKALELDSKLGLAWRVRGQILEKQNKRESALAAYETAAGFMPHDFFVWYEQANVLSSLGRHQEALVMLDNAQTIDPRQELIWAKRGQILRTLNRHPEALNAYNRALELSSSYAWAWSGKGLCLKSLRRFEEALEAFQQASRLQPEEVWHWYNQSEMLVELGRYAQALPVAAQAARVRPDHAYSWAKLAQVYRYLERYEEALQAYTYAISLNPKYAWAINGRGIVLERMQRFEEAVMNYRQAAEIAQGDVWHWYNQGNLLALQNRYSEAIPVLEKATQVDPQHARAWARLGNIYRLQDQSGIALVYVEKALKIDPHYSWAWNEQGMIFKKLNRLPEAIESFARAAQHDPTNALYWYNQADTLISLQRIQEALPLLERALKADARHFRAWAKQGQILRRLNQFEEALASYSRAVELAPDYGWAWNGRGLALMKLERYEEAHDSFVRAIETMGEDVWVWHNLAETLIALERYDDALEALDHVLKLDAHHVEGWAKRGHVLRHLGRLQESLAAYDHAVQLNPAYAWAWNGRGLLLTTLGRHEESLTSFQRAAALEPQGVWHWTNQIDSLIALGRLEEGLKIADHVIHEMDAKSEIAWAKKGQLLGQLGSYQEALNALQQALDLTPNDAWAWNEKGQIHTLLNQAQAALSCYEQAATFAPDNPTFWYNRGLALMQLQRYREAVLIFMHTLEVDPTHQPSQETLSELRLLLEKQSH